ncbi:ankyrin repeat-containing protein At5g02620-like [Gossypium arboreum]|uniref:ankyrin repeat-containing protein At5g02620-like n=1 Tax=Gossypium arboreum TaxID=29729 RepID=UPI0022F14B3C|nr:ankyrin repeat-containing protein At5g02620-like [Gossypium arboreum]
MSGGKIEAGEKLIMVVNKNHDTALHDAVRNGHEEIVNLLITRDPKLALLTNNVGESPLFIAADKRHDRIAKPILNVAPDYSIEDRNKMNVLHAAQDNEGNTALHLAVLRGHHGKIFKSMIEDVRVDKAIANSAGHTVIDILLMQEQNIIFKWCITTFVAIYEGLERGNKARKKEQGETQQSERKLEPATAIDEQDLVGEEYARFRKLNFNQVQQIASTNLPVITIIATVSFAAGFIMPGGYVGYGPNAGMLILSHKFAFRVSAIANVLAFSFSNVSMSLHFYISLKQKLDVLAFYTNYTTLLTSLAIIPMAVAFASGSYISLSFTPAFAKTVLSFGCSAYAFLYYLWFY